jgi:hypothetical protein
MEDSLSNQMQINRSHQPAVQEASAALFEQSTRPNLTGASYAIGKLLGAVWADPCLDHNEFQVASVMCFEALVDGKSEMSLAEILSASGLKLRKGRRAVQKLAAAGIVRAIRPSVQELERGELAIQYELWSPLDCALGS